jgi:hypothetical protein
MPKRSGYDSSAAVDLTYGEAARGNKPNEEVDRLEAAV